ncbi:MAG: trigger factor [Planctomycetes bacterium]|nr:trigger factor [Planctomycetota bacterium]
MGEEEQSKVETAEEETAASENDQEASTGPKNTVTIEDAGPCRKKVIIEIPEETIKSATDEQYNELRRDALVPGFRKGRAPRRLLEKRFGKETTEQIKLKLLAEASESAIKDNKIQAIGEMDVDYEKVEMPEDGALKFEFEVEVRPEFDLPELEGIEVNRTKLEVTDAQVDREIEQMQRLSGIWTPREEGPVELNDQIIAEVTLKAEGLDEDDKLGEIQIYVRRNGFVGAIPVENLDDLLVGAGAGDKRQTTVEVAKTYFREEYRGKKVDIEIEVKDIKWLKPAELDANLLERLGVEDEDDLRERTRDRLQSQLEQQSRTEMAGQIYEYLLDNTEFDLPLDVVGEQATTLLQRQYVNLLSRGLLREQIEEQMEQLRASSEEQAKEQLKTFFIMDKVADKLEIEVTEEEINGRIAQLAMRQGQRPERMREEMDRNGSLAQFRLEVRQSKCIEKLLESAKITEVEPEKKSKKIRKTAKKSTKKAGEKAERTVKEQDKKGKTTAKKKTQD